MANEKVYAKGIRVFPKHANAPKFVLGQLVITPDELSDWCKDNLQYLSDYKGNAQLKLDITEYEGKINLSVNTYKGGSGL